MTEPTETQPTVTAPAAAGPDQAELLSGLAVDGIDLAAARADVERLAAGRRRTRRLLGASAAALVLVVLGVAFVSLSGEDPDDVVADRGERSSTTTSAGPRSTTTSSTAPQGPAVTPPSTTAAPSTSVPTSTVPGPAPDVTVPTPEPPPVTVAPNQPVQARLVLVTPSPRAGEVAVADVVWSDQDHVGGPPTISADWGDPAVAVAPATSGGSDPCAQPGGPSSGTVPIQFRYATPGPHELSVVLSTCDGRGPYSERVTLTARVEVASAQLDGAPARTIVATQGRGASPVLPSLDAATARITPVDTATPPVVLPARTPVLEQFSAGGPATVLVVPLELTGTLSLMWTMSNCEGTAAVPPGSGNSPLQLPLEAAC